MRDWVEIDDRRRAPRAVQNPAHRPAVFVFLGMRLSFKVKRRSVDAFLGILEFFNSLIYDDIVT